MSIMHTLSLNLLPDGKTWNTNTKCIEEANAQKHASIPAVIPV